LEAANQHEEAEPILRRSLAELRAMVDDFPSNGGFRGALIRCQLGLSRNLISQKKEAESDAELEHARVGQERLARDFPEEARHQAQDLAFLIDRARTRQNPAPTKELNERAAVTRPQEGSLVSPASGRSDVNDYAHAMKHAAELASLSSTGWEGLEAAAEVIAGALLSIQSDQRLDAEARDKQVEDCAGQAVDFLKQAMARGYTGLRYFDTLPCAKTLQQRPDYQALLAAPVTPPVHSPRKFTFDYLNADPGPRHWVRDGVTWTETQPSGVKNVYTIAGPFVLHGMPGAKLIQMSDTPQTLFVPDVDSRKIQHVWLFQANGTWGHFDSMRDVE